MSNPAYGHCQCPCHKYPHTIGHETPCCSPEDGIDCEYTREIVCPHCGREQSDPNDITGDNEDGDTECGWCEKPFRWHRHVEITYSTEKQK